jgi:NhaA family Na+:H+ antiporter
MPRGATWRGIFGVGAVAGIGFTVSIFVAGLAFDDKPLLENDAKIGILAASIIAATIGSLVLARREPLPATGP